MNQFTVTLLGHSDAIKIRFTGTDSEPVHVNTKTTNMRSICLRCLLLQYGILLFVLLAGIFVAVKAKGLFSTHFFLHKIQASLRLFYLSFHEGEWKLMRCAHWFTICLHERSFVHVNTLWTTLSWISSPRVCALIIHYQTRKNNIPWSWRTKKLYTVLRYKRAINQFLNTNTIQHMYRIF